MSVYLFGLCRPATVKGHRFAWHSDIKGLWTYLFCPKLYYICVFDLFPTNLPSIENEHLSRVNLTLNCYTVPPPPPPPVFWWLKNVKRLLLFYFESQSQSLDGFYSFLSRKLFLLHLSSSWQFEYSFFFFFCNTCILTDILIIYIKIVL